MKKCLYCGVAVPEKAKYCSDAHRKAYTRRTQAGHNPDKNDPNNPDKPTRTFDFKLTRTDRQFEDSKPDYYKFDKLKTDKCLQCGKAFKTHLKLLRQCSPKCMSDMLKSLTV